MVPLSSEYCTLLRKVIVARCQWRIPISSSRFVLASAAWDCRQTDLRPLCVPAWNIRF